MADLRPHIERAKSSLARRQYDLAMQICLDALDIGPTELELHRILLDASQRKVKESGKAGFFDGLGMPFFGKDPHKALMAQLKTLSKNPETKTLASVAACAAVYANTNKTMFAIASFYYDQVVGTGMYLPGPLEKAADFYYVYFQQTKEAEEKLAHINKAIDILQGLEKALPARADIPPRLKNWFAIRASVPRIANQEAKSDYTADLNNASEAKKAEVLSKLVRTVEDAKEVMAYIDNDLKTEAGQKDKQLWLKKGDLERRFISIPAARISFEKAKALDQYDFTIDKRFDELVIDELKAKADANPTDAALKAELLKVEIESYRRWAEKQPLEMSHRYNLGIRLIRAGEIDAAAGEFQRAIHDSKLKRGAHRYLGFCFAKKNLLDLASQQYTAYLSLVDDDHTDEAKEVRYARASLYERLERRDDAIKDYDRIASIDLNYKDVAPRLSRLRGV